MIHWLSQAFSTYVLHVQHGEGYNWWSGAGADAFIAGGFLSAWKHLNCEKQGCWRFGHRHPDHGRPICRKHYHEDVVPSKEST